MTDITYRTDTSAMVAHGTTFFTRMRPPGGAASSPRAPATASGLRPDTTSFPAFLRPGPSSRASHPQTIARAALTSH